MTIARSQTSRCPANLNAIRWVATTAAPTATQHVTQQARSSRPACFPSSTFVWNTTIAYVYRHSNIDTGILFCLVFVRIYRSSTSQHTHSNHCFKHVCFFGTSLQLSTSSTPLHISVSGIVTPNSTSDNLMLGVVVPGATRSMQCYI